MDQGNTVCDEATLRKLYLPPYRAAIKAGVGSIMVSYSSWNGEKMHGNKYLLTDVLKGELGFQGFLVSDWAAIDQISPDYKNDIEQSINAGLDMVMIPNGPGKPNNYVEFIHDLKELVAEGKVPQSRIDDAVRRILRVKFQMGLFESTATDPTLTAAIGSPEHRAVARECVRESLVLLKNENHVLPLSKKIKHLVVVGAAADDLGMQCGGWTIDWQGGRGNVTHGGTTILAAIRQTVSPETKVTFSPDGSDVKDADAVIVVVGELPYAEMKGDRSESGFVGGRRGVDCEGQSRRRAGRDDSAFRSSADFGFRAGRQRRVRRRVAARHGRAGRGGRSVRRLQIHRQTAAHLAGQQRPPRDRRQVGKAAVPVWLWPD